MEHFGRMIFQKKLPYLYEMMSRGGGERRGGAGTTDDRSGIVCSGAQVLAFCQVSENLPLRCLLLRYYEHLFLCSMLKLHVTSSRFCLYLPNIYHFTYPFSHAHTEAHTHKHTCTISTQEEWRQPGTGAWFRGAEERLC